MLRGVINHVLCNAHVLPLYGYTYNQYAPSIFYNRQAQYSLSDGLTLMRLGRYGNSFISLTETLFRKNLL